MSEHFIARPGGAVRGSLRVPGDKSISHRSIMLGAIAEGTTRVTGFLEGADAISTMNVFRALGVRIDGPLEGRVTVEGVGPHGLKAPATDLDCGNSGTSMRLLSGLLAGQGFEARLVGDASLTRRPMKRVTEPLARMGARVMVHGRDEARGAEVVRELKAIGSRGTAFFRADFASLADVVRLAGAVKESTTRLDVLINNAGVYMTERKLTVERHELTFAVNHLAHAALSLWLLPLLRNSAPSRIIFVSSAAHLRARLEFGNLQGEQSFDGYGAYALSKLANILFASELAARVRGTGVTANSLHPGVIQTKLLGIGFPDTEGRPVEDGAATSVYLASDPSLTMVTGAYFADRRQTQPSALARDPEARRHLWAATEALLRQAGAWRDLE